MAEPAKCPHGEDVVVVPGGDGAGPRCLKCGKPLTDEQLEAWQAAKETRRGGG